MHFSRKIFIVLLLIIPEILFSQKVGVVLSGGGSRGIAHVGVLKALEDNNIPIDYIAGTSMGAVIGGLYACGYSPEQIEKLVISEDFKNWASGKINDKYKYYFKRQSPNASWFNLKFNWDTTFQTKLPTNLLSPHEMDFAFLEIFSGASALSNYDFDSLFIPFRCVAADVKNNKVEVFKEGNVAEAIRASMTYPFYFKPIEIDGKLLFDGGMYNNFPSDVVYEDFFPDIIIGSKVVDNYGEPDATDILSQIQTMLMENTSYTVICDNGVLIEPKVKYVSILDFSKVEDFIDSGYVATERKIKEIKSFVLECTDKDSISARRKEFVENIPPLVFDSIYIKGLKENQSKYIRKILRKKRKQFSISELKLEYFRLIADDKIEYIFPSATFKKKKGLYDLNLNVEKEKNLIMDIGGVITSNSLNEAFLQFEYKYLGNYATNLFLNVYVGRFYNSAKLGFRLDFPTKLPYYLSANICLNEWDFFQTTTYFFEDKDPSYIIQNDNHATINIGVPARRKAKVVAGITRAILKDEYYQTNFFKRTDTTDVTKFDFFSPHLYYERNTLNKKQWANSGTYFKFDAKYVNGKEKLIPGSTSGNKTEINNYHNYFLVQLKYQNYFFKYKKWKLGMYSELYISNRKLFQNYISSILSATAFQPIPQSKALFLDDFHAFNYGGFGLQNIFQLKKRLDFRIEAYTFVPYERIRTDNRLNVYLGKTFDHNFYLGAANLIYHSPIGPISLGVAYYENAIDEWSFNFCFGFIIFNDKALD